MGDTSLESVFLALRTYCRAHVGGEQLVQMRLKFASGQTITFSVPLEKADAIRSADRSAEQMTEQPNRPAERPSSHSQDYRVCCWRGTDYTFSPTQAACVRVLWEAWEDSIPEIGQDTILTEAGSESSRVRPLFQDHPAWGLMIISGSAKGTFRLSDP
jgi:hypothetical protein